MGILYVSILLYNKCQHFTLRKANSVGCSWYFVVAAAVAVVVMCATNLYQQSLVVCDVIFVLF